MSEESKVLIAICKWVKSSLKTSTVWETLYNLRLSLVIKFALMRTSSETYLQLHHFQSSDTENNQIFEQDWCSILNHESILELEEKSLHREQTYTKLPLSSIKCVGKSSKCKRCVRIEHRRLVENHFKKMLLLPSVCILGGLGNDVEFNYTR